MMKQLILTFIVVTMALNIADGQIVVAKDGSGNFKTIREALQSLPAHGGDVIVKAGEYFESVRLENRRDITITGEGEVWIRTTENENSFNLVTCYNVVISGISTNNLMNFNKCDANKVIGCTLKNSSRGAIEVTGSLGMRITGNTITRCAPFVILNNQSQQTIVSNNVIFDNVAPAGIRAVDCYKMEIRNNTIAYNQTKPIAIDEKTVKVTIVDNIIAFNSMPEGTGAISAAGNPYEVQVVRNVFSQNKDTKKSLIDHNGVTSKENIVADPQFTNAATRNFVLKSTSPCIGAGEDGINIGADHLVSIVPFAFREMFEDATAQFKNRNYEESVDTFRKLLKAYPGNPDAWIGFGNSCLATKQFKEGMAAYQKSLSIRPDDPVAFYNLAVGYALQDDTSESITWLEKALKAGIDTYLPETDKDLDSIRQTPGFLRLKKEYNF